MSKVSGARIKVLGLVEEVAVGAASAEHDICMGLFRVTGRISGGSIVYEHEAGAYSLCFEAWKGQWCLGPKREEGQAKAWLHLNDCVEFSHESNVCWNEISNGQWCENKNVRVVQPAAAVEPEEMVQEEAAERASVTSTLALRSVKPDKEEEVEENKVLEQETCHELQAECIPA